MRQAQRQLQVQDLFANEEFLGFEDLCERFSASRSSIRRDLIRLERKGVLRRVYGGAISLQTRDETLDFKRLSVSNHDEKVRIGKVAASLVNDGETVILGGGSSVAEVATNLSNRFIQVITNSIQVAQIFCDSRQAEVILTGGYLYPRLGVQIGPICVGMLNNIAVDNLIMGIGGATASGISDSNSLNVESIRAMMRAARKVIIVADRSKFGRDSMIHVATLNEIDQIVSDKDLDLEFQQLLEANHVECILA